MSFLLVTDKKHANSGGLFAMQPIFISCSEKIKKELFEDVNK